MHVVSVALPHYFLGNCGSTKQKNVDYTICMVWYIPPNAGIKHYGMLNNPSLKTHKF